MLCSHPLLVGVMRLYPSSSYPNITVAPLSPFPLLLSSDCVNVLNLEWCLYSRHILQFHIMRHVFWCAYLTARLAKYHRNIGVQLRGVSA